jgi:UPF0271 protein
VSLAPAPPAASTHISVDLNSDVGEGFGAYPGAPDAELFAFISSANVACGFHAGDPRTMERTVRAAKAAGVGVGAHPGFPDLVGFGRRNIHTSAEEIRTDVLYQIGALAAFCQAHDVPLHHVKPHGALYNMASVDRAMADAIVAAIYAYDPTLPIYALPESQLEAAARAAGSPVSREAFADRAYMADGTLAPRALPGSVLTDPEAVVARGIRMVRGEPIPTLDGGSILIQAETFCIHSDTPTAVPIARALRAGLEAAGIAVRPIAR